MLRVSTLVRRVSDQALRRYSSPVVFLSPNERVIRTTLGQATTDNVYGPGAVFRIPLIQQFHRVSTETFAQQIKVDALTQDRVKVSIEGAVRYNVPAVKEAIYHAVFDLRDPVPQFVSSIDSAIRQHCAGESLQQLFGDNAGIREKAMNAAQPYEKHGYKIIDVIIGSVTPPSEIVKEQTTVQTSMLRAASAKNDAEAAITKARANAAVRVIEGAAVGEAVVASRKPIMETIGTNLSSEQVVEIMLELARLETQQNVASELGKVKHLTLVGLNDLLTPLSKVLSTAPRA